MIGFDRRGVPHAYAIAAGGDKDVAVRAKRDADDPGRVARECQHLLAGVDIPEARDAVNEDHEDQTPGTCARLFYKSQIGALVGDLCMSLIYTCKLNKANPFDYLTELQRNAQAPAVAPRLDAPELQRSVGLNREKAGRNPPPLPARRRMPIFHVRRKDTGYSVREFSNFSGRVRSAILFCRCSCLVLPLLISGRRDRITSTLTRGDQVDGDCAKLFTLFRSRCRFRERVLTASEINDESREASSVFLPHDHRQAVGYALPDRAILWRAVVIADAVVRGVPLSRDLDL